jgi:hypothetical protein
MEGLTILEQAVLDKLLYGDPPLLTTQYPYQNSPARPLHMTGSRSHYDSCSKIEMNANTTMKFQRRLLHAGIFFILMIFLAGCCGYCSSGTWEDDQKNFKRAWGYSKPSEIEMVHSWYWRSAHFTREEAYFFQFQWHEQLFQELVSKNAMKHVEYNGSSDVIAPQFCFDKPQWFIPKPIQAYQTWTCEPDADCWLFRDVDTNEIFLYACQL